MSTALGASKIRTPEERNVSGDTAADKKDEKEKGLPRYKHFVPTARYTLAQPNFARFARN
jgi:hypothetical protein